MVRPTRCPSCSEPSRPAGGPLRIWGHGTQERTIWGPPAPFEEPAQVVVRVQRFLCRACHATCTVVPRGVATRYRYATFAIALAFAVWGIGRKPAKAVREAVSPWQRVGDSQSGRWQSLRRWARDVLAGRLFGGQRFAGSFAAGPARTIAARVAELASSRAPPGDRNLHLLERVWRGGAAMA